MAIAAAGPLARLLQEKHDDIMRIAERHGAYNIRVFGSVARGEARPDSDVDLLVDMKPGRSLLDLAGLMIDLEELLGCPVDAGTEASLRPGIRERVLRDAVPL